MKRRVLAGLVVLLAFALVLPSSALAFNWAKSPTSPLIVGGVHSKTKFTQLFLHNKKVIKAVKWVIKSDNLPSWAYDAAVAEINAGHIFSSSLAPGTKVGAMAFGPTTTKIVLNTKWVGKGRLPYYYVVAKNSVIENGLQITTSIKIALAKTCCNPFAFGTSVKETNVSPPTPPTHKLYVEKRQDSEEGTRLAGWEITGTISDSTGTHNIDVTTADDGSTFVMDVEEGATYNLSEIQQAGWDVVSPEGGTFSGTMGTEDATLIFVNRLTMHNIYIEKRQDSLDGTRLADFEITGTVGDQSIDVTSSCDGPTLIGSFSEGTAYNLSEVAKCGWDEVAPETGSYVGTTPAGDVTLTFVNKKQKFNLYVDKLEKKQCGFEIDCITPRWDYVRLGGWEITGTVGPDPVDVTTNCDAPTLVGTYEWGTPWTLSEVPQQGWEAVCPSTGTTSGVMPMEDLTVRFINKRVCWVTPPPCGDK